MEDFTQFIEPWALVLIPVLVFIGYCIKHKTSADNTNIPIILGVLGIGLTMLWVLAANLPFASINEVLTAVWTALVQGLLVAAGAVYANQVYKQKKEK